MNKRLLLIISLFFIFTIISGCQESEQNSDQLNVYTTIFPLEDFVKKIGGDEVLVKNLLPVGADAHTFEPTAREMIAVAKGDVFIYNGAGLEGFVNALIDTVEKEQIKVINASEDIQLHHENVEEHSHGHDHDVDPHLWLDPIHAISMSETIKNGLVELLPDKKEFFDENFKQLKEQLEQLDIEFQKMIKEAKNDTILVSHAGYGYWEKRYGIKQIGISGLSPTNEPSQRQLQEIIDLANTNQVNYIMIEKNIPTKIADVVMKATGAEALYLHNLETLMEDDLENGEDYFSLMNENIESLRIALNE